VALVAITGATGFVGGRLIGDAVAAGHRVRALTRRPQPAREGVEWTEGALNTPGALARLCEGADAAIHVAGAVNAPDRAGFWRANVDGTAAMLRAAEAGGARRFVQVSSLAAREPGLSVYGASKAAADDLVRAGSIPHVIIRPPAVYGEGDREMFELLRAVARGFAPAIGDGRFSLIEVRDLAAALLAAAEAEGLAGHSFEVDDGHIGGFSHAEFARAAGRALGRAPVIVPVPVPLLKLGAKMSELLSGLASRRPKLTRDRARYFAHPDWVADSRPLVATGVWAPRVDLETGLAGAVAWYRRVGWLA